MNTWVVNQAYERYDRMIPDSRKGRTGKLEGNISLQDLRKRRRNSQTSTTKGTRDALRNSVNKEGKEIAKEATDAYRDLLYTFL